jgi:hypothetical protein
MNGDTVTGVVENPKSQDGQEQETKPHSLYPEDGFMLHHVPKTYFYEGVDREVVDMAEAV